MVLRIGGTDGLYGFRQVVEDLRQVQMLVYPAAIKVYHETEKVIAELTSLKKSISVGKKEGLERAGMLLQRMTNYLQVGPSNGPEIVRKNQKVNFLFFFSLVAVFFLFFFARTGSLSRTHAVCVTQVCVCERESAGLYRAVSGTDVLCMALPDHAEPRAGELYLPTHALRGPRY